jgi:6-phosphofructo-2-kinase/fructose-2,6-biphosphatase 2
VGSQVIINRIQDYLQSRVVYYLMNLHIKPRSIWVSRVSIPLPHTNCAGIC